MEAIEIKCPCCKAAIVINKDSGKILKFEAFKKGPVGFGDFIEKQKSRKDDLAKKFRESKEKSKQRLQEIHEKIDFAKKRIEDQPE